MKSPKDYERMTVFEQVVDALEEGLAHARGELTLKTTILPAPAPAMSKGRVAAIRRKVGMSQSVFASFLNVPRKTLQSWEQGERTPKASEARLLQIFEASPAEAMRLIPIEKSAKSGGHRPLRRRSA